MSSIETDVALVSGVYEELERNVGVARRRLGRPLTYEDLYGRVEARPIAPRGEGCVSSL